MNRCQWRVPVMRKWISLLRHSFFKLLHKTMNTNNRNIGKERKRKNSNFIEKGRGCTSTGTSCRVQYSTLKDRDYYLFFWWSHWESMYVNVHSRPLSWSCRCTNTSEWVSRSSESNDGGVWWLARSIVSSRKARKEYRTRVSWIRKTVGSFRKIKSPRYY